MRKLQGDLADYNLIVDKSRTKTDPQEIALVYQQLKARNDAERRRVDEVFSERHEKEQDIKQVEHDIAQVQSVAEEKLNMLSQQQRMDYAQLQDDYSRLEADIQQKQTTYDNLCRQVAKYEQELHQEPNKQKSVLHIYSRILSFTGLPLGLVVEWAQAKNSKLFLPSLASRPVSLRIMSAEHENKQRL